MCLNVVCVVCVLYSATAAHSEMHSNFEGVTDSQTNVNCRAHCRVNSHGEQYRLGVHGVGLRVLDAQMKCYIFKRLSDVTMHGYGVKYSNTQLCFSNLNGDS